jgi:hypothetical protein
MGPVLKQVGWTKFVFVHITRLASTIPRITVQNFNHQSLQQQKEIKQGQMKNDMPHT